MANPYEELAKANDAAWAALRTWIQDESDANWDAFLKAHDAYKAAIDKAPPLSEYLAARAAVL